MPSAPVHPYPLVFCDLENLIGSGLLDDSEVAAAAAFLKGLFPHPRTHWIVGVSSNAAARSVLFNWPQPRRLVGRHRRGGADESLLGAMSESVPERFSGVVLCSGDGIFADQVLAFAERGIKVTLITGRGRPAGPLLQAAHRRMRIHAGPPKSETERRAAEINEARAAGRVAFDGLPPPPPRLAF